MPECKSMFELKQLPPLSLYIHLPWCVKKCPYCDFNSHTLNDKLPEDGYIDALIKDLELALPNIWGRSLQTIFIGGGTPSLFSPNALERLLTNIRSLTNLSPFAEITMEANPGTVDNQNIIGYATAGVNRISLGVQSFNANHLKVLGRIHGRDEALTAIDIAKRHFKKVNLDLMYGLPGQTLAEAMNDIDMAISLKPQHLSYYNLTLEKNTAFFVTPPENMPNDDLCYEMGDAIVEKLALNGYERYEVSAYARDGDKCQHNLNYWQFGDYLGIGAGAHSKISFHDKIIRQVRQKHPSSYMTSLLKSDMVNQSHIIEDKIILTNELAFEFMLNALRLKDGVATSLFVERTGLSLNHVLPILNDAAKKGLVELKSGKITPTAQGYGFLDDLVMMFL